MFYIYSESLGKPLSATPWGCGHATMKWTIRFWCNTSGKTINTTSTLDFLIWLQMHFKLTSLSSGTGAVFRCPCQLTKAQLARIRQRSSRQTWSRTLKLMLWFVCSSAATFRYPIYLVPKGKSAFKHIRRIITGQREPWKSGQGDRKSWTVPLYTCCPGLFTLKTSPLRGCIYCYS